MTRANVDLVTEPIVYVEEYEILTTDGSRREFDVLIGGTGFNATEPSIVRLVRGVGGVIHSEAWSPHMEALRGTTVAGFPHLFLLVGPNSALGHNSIVHITEAQIDYVLKVLDAMQASGAASVVPTREAQRCSSAPCVTSTAPNNTLCQRGSRPLAERRARCGGR